MQFHTWNLGLDIEREQSHKTDSDLFYKVGKLGSGTVK